MDNKADWDAAVYMRKLTPARVSYRHDFLISYRVYMMTGLFHISLFERTLHVDKMHVFKENEVQGLIQVLVLHIFHTDHLTPKNKLYPKTTYTLLILIKALRVF